MKPLNIYEIVKLRETEAFNKRNIHVLWQNITTAQWKCKKGHQLFQEPYSENRRMSWKKRSGSLQLKFAEQRYPGAPVLTFVPWHEHQHTQQTFLSVHTVFCRAVWHPADLKHFALGVQAKTGWTIHSLCWAEKNKRAPSNWPSPITIRPHPHCTNVPVVQCRLTSSAVAAAPVNVRDAQPAADEKPGSYWQPYTVGAADVVISIFMFSFSPVNLPRIPGLANRTAVTCTQAPSEKAELKPQLILANVLSWLPAWN